MYAVVGYDKDNDVYVEYGEYSVIQSAYQRAEELQKMIDSGELRRKDNGEPIDWIEIYGNWNLPDEHKIDI